MYCVMPSLCSLDTFFKSATSLTFTSFLTNQLAAHRFVDYWESRRQVFGEEKYLLPMTLSEAARDDANAIEAGMYCLLPKKDLSGRQLIFCEPHRHTGEGYTSESMVSGHCRISMCLV